MNLNVELNLNLNLRKAPLADIQVGKYLVYLLRITCIYSSEQSSVLDLNTAVQYSIVILNSSSIYIYQKADN